MQSFTLALPGMGYIRAKRKYSEKMILLDRIRGLRRFQIYFVVLPLMVLSVVACCIDSVSTSDNVNLDSLDTESLDEYLSEHPEDIDAFNLICKRYTQSSEYRELIRLAERKYKEASLDSNVRLMLNAAAYLGQTYLILSQPDSMYYYFNLMDDPSAESVGPGVMILFYNTLGVHNLNYAMNYNEALYNFYKALDLCSQEGDFDARAYLIMCNIVNAYYLRGDTLGLNLAKDIYKYGVGNSNDYVTYNGAYGLACMYLLRGDCEKALEYVRKTTETESYNPTFNNSDALHGTILTKMGKYREAEIYYSRAINNANDNYPLAIEAYQGYGNLLLLIGNYENAITQFLKGIEIMEDKGLYFYGYKLYDGISSAYSKIKRDDKALLYMKNYQALTDSVFNVEKERSFNNLRLRYESQKRENELKKKDIAILEQEKKVYVLLFLVIFSSTVIILVLLLYKRQSGLYKKLVISYNSSIQREKLLLKRLSVNSRKSEDKYKEVFELLDSTMMSKELYKDKNLSIESVADILGTNRLYISKAVNIYAGSSFATYVNNYRVNAAVRLLSDANGTLPIKAVADMVGYNNLPSFYSNFQKVTGVSPSKFRKELLNIEQSGDSL